MRTAISKQYILDAVSRLTATFTAATTDIITANAHGLSNGDRVELTTTTTLPAGLSLNTIYYVMVLTANTFKLSIDSNTDGNGTPVNITDTGTGTHTWTITDVGNSIYVGDFRHKNITIATAGMGAGDSIVVKVQTSSEKDAPDFHLSKSATNEWDYAQIIDLEDGSSIDGDTGITFSDADDSRSFAINDDGANWANVIITTQSDVANTSVTATINLYND
jgi:hypothetical protein